MEVKILNIFYRERQTNRHRKKLSVIIDAEKVANSFALGVKISSSTAQTCLKDTFSSKQPF